MQTTVTRRSVVPHHMNTISKLKESMNMSKPYTGDSEKQLNLHTSLQTKKQHDINVSMTVEQESQNSTVEIRC